MHRVNCTFVLTLLLIANTAVSASQTTAAAILGSVVNEHGAPIADARITAASPDGNAAGRSDAHGRFVLVGLACGTYMVTVRESWYQTPPAQIVLRPGERKHVILRVTGRSEFFRTIGPVIARTNDVATQSGGLLTQ
jgi:hypothetical protein